jgi:cytidylate kinase
MRAHPLIAIDGPAGVGKSTIGELLARRLDCTYVDTGAFYRTLTWAALRLGIDPSDAVRLTDLARTMRIAIVTPAVADGRQYTVLVDGEDVTPYLRTPEVEKAVAPVSTHEHVREALIVRMRELASGQCVVMVGRDIGTVVLPDADLKIFLETSLDERARRRHRDLVAKYGAQSPTIEQVYEEIRKRDEIDAPHMRVATDAKRINNDHREAWEVVEIITRMLEERRAGCA